MVSLVRFPNPLAFGRLPKVRRGPCLGFPNVIWWNLNMLRWDWNDTRPRVWCRGWGWCNYRLGLGIIGADSGRVIIGSSLLPGEHYDDGDDDDDDDGSLILPGEHDDDGKDGFLSLWTIHFCRTIASHSTPSLSTFFPHFSLSLIDHLKIPHHCFFATLPHKT